jgi:hypothetical protein
MRLDALDAAAQTRKRVRACALSHAPLLRKVGTAYWFGSGRTRGRLICS